jgi:hypothetical protein
LRSQAIKYRDSVRYFNNAYLQALYPQQIAAAMQQIAAAHSTLAITRSWLFVRGQIPGNRKSWMIAC